MVVTKFGCRRHQIPGKSVLQQPLLLACTWLCSLGLGWPQLPSRLGVCLGSLPLLCCSSVQLQKLHILKPALRTAHSGVGGLQSPSLLAPMANRVGQLHNTQVLLLVNQAKIESGLILSSHLEPHQVENQTSAHCLEHKELQPNHIWALASLASDSKALCVSYVLVVCVMRSHFMIYEFLRVLIFQTGLSVRKAMCFLSKNTQRLQIYIYMIRNI